MNYLKVYCNLIRKAENRIAPDGETFVTNNLNKFCRENPQYNLTRRLLCSVANGLQTHHKGWTVRKLAQFP
jgi:hypothetical protein